MPRTAAPYSAVGDLLIGDLQLPSYIDAEKYVTEASNEVDSRLGERYILPLNFTDTAADDYVALHSQFAIQRIANFLASGRILMAAATAGEDNEVHAYGLYLVNQALNDLASLVVEGAAMSPTGDPTGPSIKNVDSESAVETYYGTFGIGGLSDVWRPGS